MAILELIHASSADFGRRAFIRSKPTGLLSGGPSGLMTLDNHTRIAWSLHRRRIIQVSALSTFEGTLRAYLCDNG